MFRKDILLYVDDYPLIFAFRMESKKVKVISIGTHIKDKSRLELEMIIELPHNLNMDSLINVLNTIEDNDMSMFIGEKDEV